MKFGYGQFGLRKQVYLAHRVSWVLHYGDPGSMQVNHKCDNPKCVNPEHLFLGTQRDNMHDMIAKGREDHSKILRGQDHGSSKLNDEKVKEIWRLHLHEGLGERKLGERFGVTPANIHCVLAGKTWKHLIPKDLTPTARPKQGHARKYPNPSE